MSDTEILIVGAGPSGLMMAHELARYGIKPRIIDKQPTASTTSNALAIQSRTLEIFANIGIIDEILDQGLKLAAMNIFANGKQLVHADFNKIPSRYNFICGLPQSKTEAILNQRLQQFGITVEREKTLQQLSNNNGTTTATIVGKNGQVETVDADWIIACDGGHSSIREYCHINFVGHELTQHFVMADATLEWEQPHDELFAFFHADGPAAIIPFSSNQMRILFEVTNHPELKDVKQPSFAAIQALADERYSIPFTLSSPTWTSGFWLHERYAASYRKDNIFLIGDAAHLHSPVGGQGMNTGIQDAYNLAWKLALVIHGKANEDLLNSYQIERQPVAKSVLSFATTGTEIVSTKSSLLQTARNLLLKAIGNLNFIQQRLLLQLSELDIHYATSKWIHEHKHNLAPPALHGPEPGTRAPDVAINGQHLTDELANTKINILLLVNETRNFDNLVEKLHRAFSDTVNVLLFDLETDPESELHQTYAAEQPTAYIIRPDGYIAYRTQHLELDELSRHVNHVLGFD